MISAFWAVMRADITRYFQRFGDSLIPFLFCLMVVSLFAICLGQKSLLLAKVGPAIVWIAIVLALVWSVESIFRVDYEVGALEKLVLSPHPLPLLLFAKLVAHWLMIGLPLLFLSPILGGMLAFTSDQLWVLSITLLLGIPLFSIIGALGAALTMGLPQGGVLLAILVLPWMLPVVLLGTRCVAAIAEGLSFKPEFLLLAAMLVFLLALGPVAISAALKTSLG